MHVKFGTDGARGKRDIITNDVAWQIGAASGRLLGPQCVAVSDTRRDNPELAEAFADGVMSEGGNVINLGILPSPATAYTASHLTNEGEPTWGVAFTASHNPAGDYGIKIYGVGGRKLNEQDTEKLEALANSVVPGKAIAGRVAGTSQAVYDALRESYVQSVISSLHPELRTADFLKGKNIALDLANGAGIWSIPEIFSRLGARNMLVLHDSFDENINDNCGAEHANDHPYYVQGILKASKKDILLTFDGDADRLIAGVLGRLMNGDDIMTAAIKNLIQQNMLKKHGVVVTGYTNLGFHDEMESLGVTVMEVDNGDRYVLDGMEKEGLQVGGEFSGHVLYREPANRMGLTMSGDATVSALQMFEAEAMTGMRIKDLSDWTKYPQQLTNIELPKGVNAETALNKPEVREEIEKAESRLGNRNILVRASGTQPLIRVLGKARSQDELDQTMADLVQGVKRGVE